MNDKLVRVVPVPTGTAEAFTSPDSNEPSIGRWYWVKEDKAWHERNPEEDARGWLGCVTRLGSNYAKLEGVAWGERVHFNTFDERCTPEPEVQHYISERIGQHRLEVGRLMGKIQEVTKLLSISMGPKALEAGNETSALAVRTEQTEKELKSYKRSLVKAKEKTLPDLFKAIEGENKKMATWMKAELIPLRAQADQMRPVLKTIEGRIFNVELYAGLVETTKKVRDGKPARVGEKLHLFQRRHYMDEECLVAYEAGGMDFKRIGDFDKWLARDDNFNRILPLPKCLVAFQVRRSARDYNDEFSDWRSFVQFHFGGEAQAREKANAWTFLYIRNGEQLWRLGTEIEFDEKLFPDRDAAELKTGQLYVDSSHNVITQWEYEGLRESDAKALWKYRKERRAQRHEQVKLDAVYETELKAWEKAWDNWAVVTTVKLTKEQREKRSARFYLEEGEPKKPARGHANGPWGANLASSKYSPWTKDSVKWDDVADSVREEMERHNRLVLVLQGLFDRSLALHPHGAVKLWESSGFEAALKLIYDDSRALTSGAKPDFEAYRNGLNASLKPGSVTIGQLELWLCLEAEKYNKSARNGRYSCGNHYDVKHHHPYGNPGPGLLAVVKKCSKSKVTYQWSKKRERRTWGSEGMVECYLTVNRGEVLNASAYKAGDYKRFFADPRTRAEYLKWAPLLLVAEDWLAGKKSVGEEEA